MTDKKEKIPTALTLLFKEIQNRVDAMAHETTLSVTDLISDQRKEFRSIRNHIECINGLPPKRRNPRVLRNRGELLQTLWGACNYRHSQINRLATSLEKGILDYFEQNEYAVMEMSPYNALDDFAEEICQSQPGDPQLASTSDATAPNNFALIQGSNVKLPKITLPTFFAHFAEWIPFKESFVSLVKDNRTLDNLSKLHFLKNLLSEKRVI